MRTELTKLIHSLILESHIPAKVLAKELGKPYSTLLREINPYDSGAKLGVETLLQIMQITDNLEPLQYMAEVLGCTVGPKRPFTMAGNESSYSQGIGQTQ